MNDPLRKAFGRYITGVTVTTTWVDGVPYGFTANSFTSVSLQPPLLLVCPGRNMGYFQKFSRCSHFAINVLAPEQLSVSEIFSSTEHDRFDRVAWQQDSFGSPLLEGSIATFSCSIYRRVDGGDHLVLFGKVEAFTDAGKHNALGYSAEGYFTANIE